MVVCLAMVFATGAQPATAQAQDFTFKRLKAPSFGGKREIIQIDPEEQARLLALAPKPSTAKSPTQEPSTEANAAIAAAPSALPFDWYWREVSPKLGESAGRYAQAMTYLGKGPAGGIVPAPRMQHLQDIAGRHGADILRATIGKRVSPALVLAVIGIESAGRAEAVSSAGAVGLMQLIPATAERFGVTDSTDPAQNIKGGVAYLDWLMREFDGDPLMVLAAYNAGEGAVRKNGGVPPYAETRAYVPKVLAAWQVAQGLCQTPPELVSDPCVFKVIASGG
jgi:soluble lytic murein transglycosylase-like protein